MHKPIKTQTELKAWFNSKLKNKSRYTYEEFEAAYLSAASFSRNFQVEDRACIHEAHHKSYAEAEEHALKLKKTSHRNSSVIISSYIPGFDSTYKVEASL